jgi:hypothetical protein
MVGGWVWDLVNVRGGPSIFFAGPSLSSVIMGAGGEDRGSKASGGWQAGVGGEEQAHAMCAVHGRWRMASHSDAHRRHRWHTSARSKCAAGCKAVAAVRLGPRRHLNALHWS